jgi:radical SAM protein with 4Fe4S-binding SPASM domain
MGASKRQAGTKVLRKALEVARREKRYFLTAPSFALLFLTFRCTSRCKMCTMWQRKTDKDHELSLMEWRDVLDQLREMDVGTVEFFGGDALLRKDVLVELVRHATSLGIVSYLPTNSHLMTTDVTEGLVDAGLDFIWFSLDGIDSVHNEVRGVSKSFLRVDSALKDLLRARGRRARPFININCVISRYNLDHFEDVVQYADEMGIDAIDVEYVGQITRDSIENSEIGGMHPTPFFVSSSDDASSLLDWEGAARLKEKIAALRSKQFRSSLKINTSKVDMMSKKEMVAGSFANRRCYIARSTVTVDPYGGLSGCPQFQNFIVGDLRDEPLQALWKSQRHLAFLEARDRGDFDICQFCSMGSGRNSTPWQKMQSLYLNLTGASR